MDLDELLPRRNVEDPLSALRREDLDPLSLDELKQRIRVLEAEIERTRAKLEAASSFRSAADALFKR
ncbi:DUF1192 domain-containing protein [Pedomonas mirosovicensis]|uniref:DUF1192 domain-containing protein n=1 Tax=Pedomonas mirosovicensis TaxID=2908641 RepID=UPI00216AA9C4|nr:DUF1192 domain-containing protein [Pedomonas mirosovicensis]MCH8684744.1 DUF1192 domain-containing protein [Pedomonas mirosovicensis]